MANIDDIMSKMGIKETSGSFDFIEKVEEEAIRNFPEEQLQDNRQFIAGNPQAAGPDPSINRPKVKKDILDQIKRHETQVGVNVDKEGKFLNRIYVDKGLGDSPRKRNIGPGLNIDDSGTLTFLEKQGIDIQPLLNNNPLSEADASKLDKVFESRVLSAQKDAIKFVGGKADWKKLSPTQRKGFVDMAYNLGGPRLNKFKNSKAILKQYMDFKSNRNGFDTSKLNDEELKIMDDYFVTILGAELSDSKWFDQVGPRAHLVINQIMNDTDSVSAERWARVKRGKRRANV